MNGDLVLFLWSRNRVFHIAIIDGYSWNIENSLSYRSLLLDNTQYIVSIIISVVQIIRPLSTTHWNKLSRMHDLIAYFSTLDQPALVYRISVDNVHLVLLLVRIVHVEHVRLQTGRQFRWRRSIVLTVLSTFVY